VGFLGYSGWQLLIQVPNLLVLVAGLVLALANRRLPRGARRLLFGGLAVLLLALASNLAWMLAVPHLITGGSDINQLGLLLSPFLVLLHPIGLALVLAAAVAGRRAAGPDAPPPHWTGWPAPSTPGAGAVIPPQPTQRP
jgi:hypothetical protein